MVAIHLAAQRHVDGSQNVAAAQHQQQVAVEALEETRNGRIGLLPFFAHLLQIRLGDFVAQPNVGVGHGAHRQDEREDLKVLAGAQRARVLFTTGAETKSKTKVGRETPMRAQHAHMAAGSRTTSAFHR